MKKTNPFSMIRYLLHKHKIPDVVMCRAEREKQIVYGSKAMNIQLPVFLRRESPDFDVFTPTPRKTANLVQRQLDRRVAGGQNDFYHRRAIHPGTWKVLHEGEDGRQRTRDDIGVVDYSKPTGPVNIVMINGVRHETLGSIVKGKRKTLRDPKSKYRHAKDSADIARIQLAQKIKRVLTLRRR